MTLIALVISLYLLVGFGVAVLVAVALEIDENEMDFLNIISLLFWPLILIIGIIGLIIFILNWPIKKMVKFIKSKMRK